MRDLVHPSRPVHLDFTTIYGVALSLESSVIRREGLPLSRLLSLSQFVEALVLHESLQFELAETAEWRPYCDSLRQTMLFDLVKDRTLPLTPTSSLADESPEAVVQAATWAVEILPKLPLQALEWAVRFRPGTYDTVPTVRDDRQNPVTERYFNLIRRSGDAQLRSRFNSVVQYLGANEVSPLALFVLIRLNLLEGSLLAATGANYEPHYSRQPLFVAATDWSTQVQTWTMDQLARKRSELIEQNEPGRQLDPLGRYLSPVFLACVSSAQTPYEIITRAIELRESSAAKAYRAECRKLMGEVRTKGEQEIQKYKTRIRVKIDDLRNFLFEHDVKAEISRNWAAVLGLRVPLEWGISWRQSKPAVSHSGDEAVIFLSEVLSQALGVLHAERHIRRIFGIDSHYDTFLISCVPPREARL